MKRALLTGCIAALLSAGAGASQLVITDVAGPAINCLFNTNCVITPTDTSSPIVLSNTTGSGFLQTRTFLGETGSLAQGLYGYLYRVDLTGITANSNAQPCLTNVVRCETNVVRTFTNHLVCQTNQFAASNRLACVTNVIPATNIVFRFTNTIPASNFVVCVTNPAGGLTCITNSFPGTNIVTTFTNRIGRSNVVTCTTVFVPATNRIDCVTNRVAVTNRVIDCVTNLVSCPGTAPCIESLTLNFGPAWRLDFGVNGSNTQVFAITVGGLGVITPASAEQQSNGVVTVHFANALCPGESSVFFGLVSSNRPVDSRAVLDLTSGSNLVVAARTPRTRSAPITCDFHPLLQALQNLPLGAFQAPTPQAQAGRRGSLVNAARAAMNAAEEGDMAEVLDALDHIAKKTGTDKNAWLRPPAADGIDNLLHTLLDCLQAHTTQE